MDRSQIIVCMSVCSAAFSILPEGYSSSLLAQENSGASLSNNSKSIASLEDADCNPGAAAAAAATGNLSSCKGTLTSYENVINDYYQNLSPDNTNGSAAAAAAAATAAAAAAAASGGSPAIAILGIYEWYEVDPPECEKLLNEARP